MKKVIRLTSILALGVLFTFCGKKEASSQVEENVGPTLSQQDSVIVTEKAVVCLETLKNGNLDDALAMLYVVDDDGNVEPMDEELNSTLKSRFQKFPVLSYVFDSYDFIDEDHLILRYVTEYMEPDTINNMPNTVPIIFNPVMQNGEWYLTLNIRRRK